MAFHCGQHISTLVLTGFANWVSRAALQIHFSRLCNMCDQRYSHQSPLDWARLWTGVRPMWRTACLKTPTSGRPCQREGPSPLEWMCRCACERHATPQPLHPGNGRHVACLERVPQTVIAAPLGPWNIQNATTRPVRDTQTCSDENSQLSTLHVPNFGGKSTPKPKYFLLYILLEIHP